MSEPISRRTMLLASATLAAAGPSWTAAAQTTARAAPPALDPAWRPLLLNHDQARSVAYLAEAILPRTETPGAIDARVHELIDLELSVAAPAERERFLEGLAWVEARSQRLFGRGVAADSDEERARLLSEISDEKGAEVAELAPGMRFFAELKRRTIFGYYTSEVGRTEGLGLPDAVTMETFRGCTHREGGRG
jgi:hypothetical protein